MWTAYAIAQDSINFSLPETRILLAHHVNYSKLQKIADSCDIQEAEFKRVIKNDSIIKCDCAVLLKTKDRTIAATELQVEENKKGFKKAVFWNKFWRGGTGLFGLVALIEGGIIYLTIK